MSENTNIITMSEVGGTISYSEEVIAIISGLAATEIKGVAGMSGSTLKAGLGELLGKKDFTKGIKATINENEVVIDANIIVNYGSVLNEVATEVQASIKRSIESMTGLLAVAINVNIVGVQITEAKK